MTDQQWDDLLRVMRGEILDPAPIGFIIDCPWLPGWTGMSILDYLAGERNWFEANRRVVERFPRVMFLPGFWSEYGMCTEPSAFGARCVFPENEFPFPLKLTTESLEFGQLPTLVRPNPKQDGFCPIVLKRMELLEREMADMGHRHRFATCRGPLNIATYLVGHSEFLSAMAVNPDQVHEMLECVTGFLVDWLQYQKERFPSIEGMLVLDDIIGFVGGDDFDQFVMPYLKRIAAAFDAPVKMLHNDAMGKVTAKRLDEMGFNMFNFAFDIPLPEARELSGDSVVLLGNLPPRDVLAAGTPEDVFRETKAMVDSIEDKRRIIYSVGGGMPPNVSTENIEAFIQAIDGI
jgi:uroporphyrinogen-III decarboxylase